MKRCPKCSAAYPDHLAFCPKDGIALDQVSEDEAEELVQEVGSMFTGNYRITGHLGSGGMGAVYKAEHCFLKRTVAIKVLHPNVLEDQKALARFQREAEVANRLDHPNATALYDFGIEDGRPYLVMEFVEGETLKKIIAKEGRLTLPRTLALAKQIAAALSAAHDLGVLHRDLKPDNIMVTALDGGVEQVTVLDFGISKILDPEDPTNNKTLTRTGMLIGTPKYMSPEQAAAKPIDQRSDIYSLCVVFYEMISGDVPYQADSPVEMIVQHMQGTPRKFEKKLKIPKSVEQVLLRGLSKEPEDRFSTVGELIVALEAAITGKPLPLLEDVDETLAYSATPQSLASAPVQNDAKRSSKKLVFAVALLLLLPAVAAVYFFAAKEKAVVVAKNAPATSPEPTRAASGTPEAIVDPPLGVTPEKPTKSDPAPTTAAIATAESTPRPKGVPVTEPDPTPSDAPRATPEPTPRPTETPVATSDPTPVATAEPTAIPSATPRATAESTQATREQPSASPKSSAKSLPPINSPSKPPAGIYLEALTKVSKTASLSAANILREAGIQAYSVNRQANYYDVLVGPHKNLWSAMRQGDQVKRVLGTNNAITVTRQVF